MHVSWHPDLSVTLVPGGTIAAALEEIRDRETPRHGLHVSTIVEDIQRTLDPKRYEQYEKGEDGTRWLYQDVGNALEWTLAEYFRRQMPGWVKPEPRTVKGITGSPDGWHERSRTIDEIKATWVSPKDFLDGPKFQSYIRQSLPYAYMWGARRLRLHILFVAGVFGRQPEALTINVRWQDGAAERGFENLIQHAQDRRWL